MCGRESAQGDVARGMKASLSASESANASAVKERLLRITTGSFDDLGFRLIRGRSCGGGRNMRTSGERFARDA